MFQTVPLSTIRSFTLYTQQWYMLYWFAESLQAVGKPVWNIPLLCVQWKTPDDGQRNCLKHVVSFQNKFVKLVHLVGLLKEICHDAWSHEHRTDNRVVTLRQIRFPFHGACFNWTPLYIFTYFTTCVLNYDLCKTWLLLEFLEQLPCTLGNKYTFTLHQDLPWQTRVDQTKSPTLPSPHLL